MSGQSEVGGLVGMNEATASINNGAATGGVNGTAYFTGGLVGANNGTIQGGSSASGAVTGVNGAGGIAGYSDGHISGATATNPTVSARPMSAAWSARTTAPA